MKDIRIKFTAIFLAVIFTMACTFTAFSVAGDVSLSSDVQNKSISILGQLVDDGGIPYIVNITRYGEDVLVSGESNNLIDSRLFTTYQNGYIGINKELGETIYIDDVGRYTMHIYYNEGNTPKEINRSFFIIDSTDPDTVNLLNNLNSANSVESYVGYLNIPGALEMIGIADEDIASSGEEALKHSFYIRPVSDGVGVYDIQTLQNAIFEGEVVYIIKTYGVEALTKNTTLLGSSYINEYSTLTSAEKNELNNLLKTANYTEKTLPEVFEDKLFTAKIKCCTNRTDMQTEILGAAVKLGISVGVGSDYYNIPNLNKSEVFNLMLNDKAGFASMIDVASSFVARVSDVLSIPVTPQGGGISTSSQSSSGNILHPGSVPTESKDIFNDISSHFAKNDITKLASLGIINGFEDGSYRPYDNVTRAQYAKLICTALSIDGGTASYEDVPYGEWYFEYISALASQSIITGYEGHFYPNENIKREDAALIISRAVDLFNLDSENNDAISFADDAEISPYAKDAITKISKLGIMNGDGTNFYPLNFITRGEVAAVVSRIYDIYKAKGA